ncbi:MAG: PDZ domain-containing protein [Gammaproteobacteria bacterium]|nr:PDZ domain-containing protein [Gammaproteobacteria bacterium]
MRILALVPLLALVSGPQALQAQSDEERLEEWLENLQKDTVALVELRGSRIGVGVGNWAEGPVDGLVVLSVSPRGPAEKAGLRAGDLLTAIDEESLVGDSGDGSYRRLRDFLAATEPGSEVTISYRRDGHELQTQVTTALWTSGVVSRIRTDMPPGIDAERMVKRTREMFRGLENRFTAEGGNVDVEVEVDEDTGVRRERRIVTVGPRSRGPLTFSDMAWRLGGLQVAELTPTLGEYFGVDEGLLVVRAPENEDIGLEDGDVIRKIGGRTFRDARQATRILRSYEPGEEVELEVVRHKRSRTVRFELPERSGRITRGNLLRPSAPAVPEAPQLRGRDPT